MPAPKIAKRLLVGIVLDRSSSMGTVQAETISGTNEQFSALRDSEDAANTFVAFNTFNGTVTPVFKDDQGAMDLVPCADLKDIGEGNYFPNGMTAMYDGVDAMIEFLSGTARPIDDVMVVVISDGEENASQKITSEKLASKIKELQDGGWNFTYIGANQDLTQVTAKLGIHAGNTLSWQSNSVGTRSAHGTVASALHSYTVARSSHIKSGLTSRVTTQNLYDMNDDNMGSVSQSSTSASIPPSSTTATEVKVENSAS